MALPDRLVTFLEQSATRCGEGEGDDVSTTLRPSWAASLDKLTLRNRRLRGLLLDCYRLLQDPGPAEGQLDRRARLAARIQEECAE